MAGKSFISKRANESSSVTLVLLLAWFTPAIGSDDLFETVVRPTLIAQCFECHGKSEIENGLRVDSRAHLLLGGDSGPALVPGDAEASILVKAIRRTQDDLTMPPDVSLEPHVIAAFEEWINKGAKWPEDASLTAFSSQHWSYQPIAKCVPPAQARAPFTHPVDRFVWRQWQACGLKKPVEMADARTLVRRLYFDLLGLPPTPEQMQDAVESLSPWSEDEWMALVDRLLQSRHYGERWGRHWLDVARYADTAGDNADYPIPEAYRYRDYVIDAFNSDKPYDEFVREQIAGDLLAAEGPREHYAERVTATGFLAISRRYATGPYELWHLSLEDTIDTVGQAFTGMTLRCARCHDHKFDPISQRDYYALYGIFASTQYPWAGAEEFHSQKTPRMHFVSLLPPEETAPLREAHDRAVKSLDDADAELKNRFQAASLRGYPDEIPSVYGVQDGTPHSVALQHNGDPGRPGAVVPRGVPSFLRSIATPKIPETQSGRRQLAEWLTRSDHPLTARVMVNRIWHWHFGRGLVETPSNFGMRGADPTHPRLLDWLAARFIADGWSIKQLHRLILASRTYRLSSQHNSANAAIDPGNLYLWRYNRRRLDAESIRDSLLAISGRLDRTSPGPHPFPAITSWTYTQHSQFRDFYPSRHRSVYLMTKRLQRHPFLALFDGPDTNSTTDRRRSSIVPSQALYLMNSDEVKDASEAFARRVLGEDADKRIERAFLLAFQRDPTDDEQATASRFLSKYSAASDQLSAWTAFCRSLLTSHEVLYVE